MKNQVVSQLKSMIEEITISESKKYHINMNTNSYTIIDYLNVEALQKKISLQKKSLFLVKALMNFKRVYGYYNAYEDKIVVLLRNKIYQKNALAKLLFHECRHGYQSYANNYIGFLWNIETIVLSSKKRLYQKHHDIFFIEIDASQYGYKSAMDYLKKYNILSEKQKKEYELRLQVYNNYLSGYNPLYMFNSLNSLLLTEHNEEWFKEFYPNSWLKEIYNESGEMKSYKEILQNSYFQSLDEISQNIIMISSAFLSNIEIHSLNDNEKGMLLRAIKYANQIKENNDKQSFEIMKKIMDTKMNSVKVMENILYQKKHNFWTNKGTQGYLKPIYEQLNQEFMDKENEKQK